MQSVQGKVAFITGGASGIGLGMAKAFSHNGMKVIIADLRRQALDEALEFFRQANQSPHAIQLDVTDRAAFARAADEAEAVFGKVHVLVNNTGVGGGGPLQNATYKDWDFMLGVNLGGVINGLVTFLPRMLKHGEEGHVVSTSSTNGIFAVDGTGLYCAGKYAVAGIMETLAADLKHTPLGASVFFPGPIASNLGVTSHVCRPEHLKNEGQPAGPPKRMQMPFDPKEYYMDPVEAGERVLRGIRRKDLFIITHSEFRKGITARNEALLRAIPDEAPVAKRHDLLKHFGTLLHNPIYDGQTRVGPFNETRSDA